MSVKRFRRSHSLVLYVLTVLALLVPILPAQALSSTEDAAWRVDGEVFAVLRLGDLVYVGGTFSTVRSYGGQQTASRNNLAAFNAYTGQLVTGFAPNPNGVVYALAGSDDGSRLYVGGGFSRIAGTNRNRIAGLQHPSGNLLGSPTVGASREVRALRVSGSKLYVGGAFATLGGITRTRLGRIDLNSNSVDSDWAPSANGLVRSIAMSPSGDRVYVAGSFSQIDNVGSSDYLVGLSPSNANVVWNPSAQYEHFDVVTSGTSVYAAVGGPAGRVRSYRATNGSVAWTQIGNGDVQAVSVNGSWLYVGGHFRPSPDEGPSFAGQDLNYFLARVNAGTGALDAAFAPQMCCHPGVWSTQADVEGVYVGGEFNQVNNQFNRGGYAQWTDGVSGGDSEAPTVPSSVQVSDTDVDRVTLTWNASTDDQQLSGYRVHRDGNLVAEVASATYEDIGLTPGTTYSYRISAFDAAGNESNRSAPAVNATTDADTTAPTTPGNVVATQITETTLTLGWSASTDDVGVAGYRVTRDGVEVHVGPSTSFDDSGLTANTSYVYRVEAFDSAGNSSAPSPPRTVRTQGPPGTPVTLLPAGSVWRYLDTGADPGASWHQPGFSDAAWLQGPAQLGYGDGDEATAIQRNGVVAYFRTTLQVADVGNVQNMELDLLRDDGAIVYLNGVEIVRENMGAGAVTNTTLASSTVFGSGEDTFYTFQIPSSHLVEGANVLAVRVHQADAGSSDISFDLRLRAERREDLVAPGVPTNVRVDDLTDTTVDLAWDASTDDSGGVVTYQVLRDGSPVGSPTTDLTFTDTGLTPETAYDYTVTATDVAGNTSAESAAVTATTEPTPDTTAPDVPANVRVVALTDTTVDLAWDASADDSGGVVTYQVLRDGSPVGSPTTELTFTDTGLTPETAYDYTVTATDESGNASAASSPAVTATTEATPDTTPPDVPANVRVVALTDTTVDLAWDASADDSGGTVTYQVLRDGSPVASPTTALTYTDTGLTPATAYDYTVTATDESGNSSAASVAVTATTSDTTAPSVPAGVRVDALTDTTVDLAWDASADDSGGTVTYQVLRDGSPVGSPTTELTFTDTGLTPETAYDYTVTATDESGNASAASSPAVTATTEATPDTTPPDVPANVRVVALTDTTVDLAWDASADDSGGTVTYQVLRDGSPVGSPTTELAFTDTGLTPETAYDYTVTATDESGNSSVASVAVTATTEATPDTTAPDVPANVQVTGQTDTTVSLSWDASADDSGGTVTYQVLRDGSPVGSPTTELTFTDTGLSPATSYDYTVTATDEAGNTSAASSPPTQGSTDLLPDSTPPSVPAGVQVTGQTDTTASLAWDASTDNSGGTVTYQVLRDGSPVGSPTTDLTFTDTGLTPETAYDYTVTAEDAAGNTSAESSPAVTATTEATPDTTPPSVPGNVRVVDQTHTTVELAWDASTDDSGGAVTYQVYRDGAPIGAPQSELTYTDTGLTPETAYSYTVTATDAAGNESDPSANVTPATTQSAPDVTAPDVPANVRVTGQTDTTVDLAWDASTDDSGGVVTYEVLRDGSPVGAPTTELTFTDTGLTPETAYDYTVTATDESGNASAASSPAVTATTEATPDTTAPDVPANVQVTGQTQTTVDLSWDASADDSGGTVAYQVLRDGAPVGSPTTDLTFSDSGLTAGTSYDYTVTASDEAGNTSAESVAVTATTDAVPAGPQTVIAAGSVWRYLDDGSDQGTAWREPAFDASGWASGGTQIGFGDGDEVTTLQSGFVTYYMRRTFVVSGASGVTDVDLQLVRDDGAAVYINGQQVIVDNLQSADPNYQTRAASVVASQEDTFLPFDVDPSVLVEGTNTIAVSIHNRGPANNDLGFDLSLTITGQGPPPPPDTTAPSVPGNVRVTGQSDTTVDLAWDASTDDSGGFLTYQVLRDGSPVGSPVAGMTFTDTGLTPETAYDYTVTASDPSGNTSAASSPPAVGTTTAVPAGPQTVIAAGSVWRYLDDGSDQGTAWREPAFDASGWASGGTQIGFGDGDEVTTLQSGFVTYYMRRTFVVSGASGVTDVDLQLVRDDGAAVYINGQQVIVDNLQSADPNYQTRAASVVASQEDTFLPFDVDPSVLVEGTNTIAVSIHNRGPANNDLGFDLSLTITGQGPPPPPDTTAPSVPGNVRVTGQSDTTVDLAWDASTDDSGGFLTYQVLRDGSPVGSPVAGMTFTDTGLTPETAYDYTVTASDPSGNTSAASSPPAVGTTTAVPAGPQTVIAAGSVWRYLDDGSDQGTAWREPAFDASAWPSGPTQIGFGDGDEVTTLQSGFVTYYMRRTFVVSGASGVTDVDLQLVRDDGAAVYINGQQVIVDNLQSADPNYQTRAASVVASQEDTFLPFDVDPSVLVEGTNTIAVSIHNRGPANNDLGFDLSLTITGA